MNEIKKCTRCKEEKAFNAFCKNKQRKDGLQEQCKLCNKRWRDLNKETLKKLRKKYYEANKEKIIEQHKIYNESNKSIIAKSRKKYRENNKGTIAKCQKEWREANKEKIRVQNKIYRDANKYKLSLQQKMWQESHKKEIAERKKNYLKNNLHRHNANSAKRRASKKQATPLWADLEEIKNVYLEAKYFDMHVDHIVPLQSDIVCGLHVWDNLQLLHPSANISKGNRYWPDMP